MEKNQLKQFLTQYEIPETNGYILGVFQSGITVYNQQLRSLNILHALYDLEVLTKNDSIAVIGGGIAGLTFTTAALKLGLSIDLFERAHILVPYQYGCETRRIHPHFYTWPEPFSEYPYCDLPFFNWQHETASTVAKNIYDTFKSISKQAMGFNEFRGTKLSGDDIKWGPKVTTIEFDSKKGHQEKSYTKVIVATGFGIEKRVEINLNTRTKEITNASVSYWRNDEFEQTSLTKDASNTYIISGTGDGALIDLFRLKLRGFTVKLILDKLGKDSKNYKDLKLALLEIRKKYDQQPAKVQVEPNNFLYNEFDTLNQSGLLTTLNRIVKSLSRKDNFVILHHRKLSIKELLDLRRASMFNNLVAYSLFNQSLCGFKRVQFTINYARLNKENILRSEAERIIDEQKEEEDNDQISSLLRSLKRRYPDAISEENVKLILRHGTDIEASLDYVGITRDKMDHLKKKQLEDMGANYLDQIWEPGWWNKFFKDKEKAEPVEFVEPDLVVICNTFVSALANIIELTDKRQASFRVVLHRVVNKKDSPFFQQISHYYGDKNNVHLNRPVGRIFPLEIGLVGYSCKTGRSLLLVKTEGTDDYRITWDALMTPEKPRGEGKFSSFESNDLTTDSNEAVKSIFTCPIFVEIESKISPIFCLYIESDILDFQDLDVIRTIYSMLAGFVNLLVRASSEQKIIHTEDLSDSLFRIDSNFKDSSFNRVIEDSTSLKPISIFEEYRTKMTFKGFTPHYVTLTP